MSRLNARTAYLAVGFMMAFHLLFGAIVVERMAEFYVGGHEALFVYRAVCLIILATMVALMGRNDVRIDEIPPIFWLLTASIPLGIAVGLAHGRGLEAMFSHGVQAATAWVGFCAGYLFLRERYDLWAVFKATSYAALVIVPIWVAVFMLIVSMRGMEIPHYSLNFFVLIIPFGYFLANRQGGMALLTFVLMIIVGKRSIMFAGLGMMIWFFVLAAVQWKRDRSGQRIRPWHWFAMVFCAAVRVGLPFAPSLSVPSNTTVSVPSGLGPITDFGRTAEVTNLNELSSFRGDLILSVVDMMNSDPVQWLTGAGFGSSFVFRYRDVASITAGVDLMPLHLAMLYGIPFTLAFFAVTIWLLIKASFWTIQSEEEPLLTAIILMLGGFLLNSMFTFVSIDPVFWFVLGACCWTVRSPKMRMKPVAA